MTRTKPPFRADHVGSLLRSAEIQDARAKRGSGEIDADQLRQVEDREIAAISYGSRHRPDSTHIQADRDPYDLAPIVDANYALIRTA